MFSNRNPFIHDRSRHLRRQSQVYVVKAMIKARLQFERQLHACFHEPAPIFANAPAAESVFHRIYWALRSAQYKVFYKTDGSWEGWPGPGVPAPLGAYLLTSKRAPLISVRMPAAPNLSRDKSALAEVDDVSLSELAKYEPSERPPSLHDIQECTKFRFSDKWIKYMYAKFKNECPSGRMRDFEFKRLFGAYIPSRTSDAYLDRLFRAFLHASTYPDQLTFKDMVVCLSHIYDQDPKVNADWTMRLINGCSSSRVNFHEFRDFVTSVFALTGADPSLRADSLVTAPPPVDEQAINRVVNRAVAIFKELDRTDQGYLTVEDLETLFRSREHLFF